MIAAFCLSDLSTAQIIAIAIALLWSAGIFAILARMSRDLDSIEIHLRRLAHVFEADDQLERELRAAARPAVGPLQPPSQDTPQQGGRS